MTFTVGGADVTAVHVGATAANAVYLGADKVWPSKPTLMVEFDGPDWTTGYGGGVSRYDGQPTDRNGVDFRTWFDGLNDTTTIYIRTLDDMTLVGSWTFNSLTWFRGRPEVKSAGSAMQHALTAVLGRPTGLSFVQQVT